MHGSAMRKPYHHRLSARPRTPNPVADLELVRRWQEHRDVSARDELVVQYLPIARWWVHKFPVLRQLDLVEDAVQETVMGLMIAIDRYDPERAALNTYATIWIRAQLYQYVLKVTSGIVRRPGTRTGRAIAFSLARYENALGADATAEAVAELSGATVEEVEHARMRRTKRLGSVSLDEVGAGGTPLSERFASSARTPEAIVEELEAVSARKALLVEFRKTLGERERVLFDYRMCSDEPLQLRELGAQFSVSHERVRQIELQILRRLKKFFEDRGVDGIDLAT